MNGITSSQVRTALQDIQESWSCLFIIPYLFHILKISSHFVVVQIFFPVAPLERYTLYSPSPRFLFSFSLLLDLNYTILGSSVSCFDIFASLVLFIFLRVFCSKWTIPIRDILRAFELVYIRRGYFPSCQFVDWTCSLFLRIEFMLNILLAVLLFNEIWVIGEQWSLQQNTD